MEEVFRKIVAAHYPKGAVIWLSVVTFNRKLYPKSSDINNWLDLMQVEIMGRNQWYREDQKSFEVNAYDGLSKPPNDTYVMETISGVLLTWSITCEKTKKRIEEKYNAEKAARSDYYQRCAS